MTTSTMMTMTTMVPMPMYMRSFLPLAVNVFALLPPVRERKQRAEQTIPATEGGQRPGGERDPARLERLLL